MKAHKATKKSTNRSKVQKLFDPHEIKVWLVVNKADEIVHVSLDRDLAHVYANGLSATNRIFSAVYNRTTNAVRDTGKVSARVKKHLADRLTREDCLKLRLTPAEDAALDAIHMAIIQGCGDVCGPNDPKKPKTAEIYGIDTLAFQVTGDVYGNAAAALRELAAKLLKSADSVEAAGKRKKSAA